MRKDNHYVLYAEDNPNDATFFTRAFRDKGDGFELVHRQNGILVRQYLRDCLTDHTPLPHLVLLDIKMPGLTGLDILEFIRSTPELAQLPVVILSASAEQRDLNHAYRNRVNAYLMKPDRYQHLKRLVGALCTYWLHFNRVAV